MVILMEGRSIEPNKRGSRPKSSLYSKVVFPISMEGMAQSVNNHNKDSLLNVTVMFLLFNFNLLLIVLFI